MKLLARLADRILNHLAPLPIGEPTDEWLADIEAGIDTWDVSQCRQCFPNGWEDQLHDAVAVVDDDTPDPAPRPASASSRGGAEPAGTGPLSPVPAGAPPHPAVVLSRTLRDIGFAIPAAAAEILAIELTNFYNLTPKKK